MLLCLDYKLSRELLLPYKNDLVNNIKLIQRIEYMSKISIYIISILTLYGLVFFMLQIFELRKQR
jgi:hypothetical protein